MKKKGFKVAVGAVLGLFFLGFLSSRLIDWPVDTSSTSGNIAKSSRFSRKAVDPALSNMEEMLVSNETFKSSMVMAFLVMQTRADQFNALVELSNEVAGGLSAFEGVLAEMNEAKPIVENVSASIKTASQDVDAALGGGSPENLAQNATNATLAYAALGKQNALAGKFVEVADAYIAANGGSDQLKFVRDEWLEYKKVTAQLSKDAKEIAEAEKQEYLLSSEKASQTLGEWQRLSEIQPLFNGGIVNDLILLGEQNYIGYSNLVRSMEIMANPVGETGGPVFQGGTTTGPVVEDLSRIVAQQQFFESEVLNNLVNESELLGALGVLKHMNVGEMAGLENLQEVVANEVVKMGNGVAMAELGVDVPLAGGAQGAEVPQTSSVDVATTLNMADVVNNIVVSMTGDAGMANALFTE